MTKVSSRLQVSGVDDEHGQEVSMVRAGGVHGDGRGVGNKGKVSSRLQVSGVNNEHGQEVSTVRAGGVNGEGRRCQWQWRRCQWQWQRCQQQGRGVNSEVS